MTKFYKILFFNLVLFSIMMMISSFSWMIMWISMEINLLAVIPIISSEKNIYSKEAAIKYFLIQVMASTIMIFSMIMIEQSMNLIFSKSNFTFMMHLSMFMKLGLFPAHFWFPEVMEGLGWNNCLIILTLQKISPMIVIMILFTNSIILNLSLVMSSLISSTLSINQMSMRKILAYSSINHMVWMIMSMMTFSKFWATYFVIYSILSMSLIFLMKNLEMFYFNQIPNLNMNKKLMIFFFMNILSLAGLPPMIGFAPKWLVISWMLLNLNLILTTIMIMTTLIMMYTYLRMVFSSMMMVMNSQMTNFDFKLNYLFYTMSFFFNFSLIIVNILF